MVRYKYVLCILYLLWMFLISNIKQVIFMSRVLVHTVGRVVLHCDTGVLPRR